MQWPVACQHSAANQNNVDDDQQIMASAARHIKSPTFNQSAGCRSDLQCIDVCAQSGRCPLSRRRCRTRDGLPFARRKERAPLMQLHSPGIVLGVTRRLQNDINRRCRQMPDRLRNDHGFARSQQHVGYYSRRKTRTVGNDAISSFAQTCTLEKPMGIGSHALNPDRDMIPCTCKKLHRKAGNCAVPYRLVIRVHPAGDARPRLDGNIGLHAHRAARDLLVKEINSSIPTGVQSQIERDIARHNAPLLATDNGACINIGGNRPGSPHSTLQKNGTGHFSAQSGRERHFYRGRLVHVDFNVA
jgi:hypothetical protein